MSPEELRQRIDILTLRITEMATALNEGSAALNAAIAKLDELKELAGAS